MTGPAILSRADLDELIAALIADGYRVIGPTVRDSAIVLAELSSGADAAGRLGRGHRPGLVPAAPRADDQAVFGHSAGPQSWKQFLHPPRQRLWSADAGRVPSRAGGARRGTRSSACARATWPRSRILDRVLGGGAHPDSGFTRRRAGLFVIAVNCTEPGGVCFCASMGTGPRAGPGYDLALTERIDDGRAPFRGRRRHPSEGAGVLAVIRASRPAAEAEIARPGTRSRAAAGRMGRQMPDVDLPRPAARQPRVAALGRGRRALPDLRQLHDGLPDLLLHHAPRTAPT